jgi:hypothetical protein
MQVVLLLVLGTVGIVALIGAIKDTGKVQRTVKIVATKTKLPRMFGMLLMVVQVGEFARAVEHLSPIHIAATLLLFALWLGMRSGTESEML